VNANTAERPIYFDYHASTPTDPRVAAVVLRHMTEVFGNASSTDHAFGDAAAQAVDAAAQHVAKLIGAEPRDILFTSGSTESLNLGILGLVRTMQRTVRGPLRVGVMPVEHRAVLDICEVLASQGDIELRFLHIDDQAQLDLNDFERKCRAGLDLVCVMAANNEVGTIYPVREASAIARQYGSLFLTDATQAVGRVPLEFAAWGIDLLTTSGHKMYGPKGVGALAVAPGVRLAPILYGGGHQRGIRSGTLNVPGIAGLGEACRLRSAEMSTDEPRIAEQRNRLLSLLTDQIPDLAVNGSREQRLAGNLHVSVPGAPNRAVASQLRKSLALSTGAACSSRIEAPSHVLIAMGLTPERVEGALRIGIGKFTTAREVDRAAELISAAVARVRTLMAPPQRALQPCPIPQVVPAQKLSVTHPEMRFP
jgi:cysteine desulfurase